MNRAITLSLILSLALLLSACGGGGGSDDAQTPADTVSQDALPEVTADVPADAFPAETAADTPAGESVAETADPDLSCGDACTPEDWLAGETADDASQTGTIALTGSLALEPPVPQIDAEGAGYIVALLPGDYVFAPGMDPGPDILAAAIALVGKDYDGSAMALPEKGLVINQWLPGNDNPMSAFPYLALPGTYVLLIAFQPSFGSDSQPSHVYFGKIDVEAVPAVESLGDVVLSAMGSGPDECPFTGEYSLFSIACDDLDVTAGFKETVTSTTVSITQSDGGGCAISAMNMNDVCMETEDILAEQGPDNWFFDYKGVTSCMPSGCSFNQDDAPCVVGDRKGQATGSIEWTGNGKLKVTASEPAGHFCTDIGKAPTIMVLQSL